MSLASPIILEVSPIADGQSPPEIASDAANAEKLSQFPLPPPEKEFDPLVVSSLKVGPF
ncbi:MAG: hypothetical protein ACK52I_04280 [Pseudomonadota bacterium]